MKQRVQGQCQVSLAGMAASHQLIVTPLFYLSRTLGPGVWNRKEGEQWRRTVGETVL